MRLFASSFTELDRTEVHFKSLMAVKSYNHGIAFITRGGTLDGRSSNE